MWVTIYGLLFLGGDFSILFIFRRDAIFCVSHHADRPVKCTFIAGDAKYCVSTKTIRYLPYLRREEASQTQKHFKHSLQTSASVSNHIRLAVFREDFSILFIFCRDAIFCVSHHADRPVKCTFIAGDAKYSVSTKNRHCM